MANIQGTQVAISGGHFCGRGTELSRQGATDLIGCPLRGLQLPSVPLKLSYLAKVVHAAHVCHLRNRVEGQKVLELRFIP